MDGLQLLHLPVGLLEEARIFKRHRHLVGHVLEGFNILLPKRGFARGLDIQRADDAFADGQRQGDLGAGVGEQGIVESGRFRPNVQGDARLSFADGRPHHAFIVHCQPVARFAQDASRLAGGVFQFRPFAGLVHQEDGGIVMPEALGDQVGDFFDQFVRVEDRADGAPDLVHRRQLGGALGHLLFEGALQHFETRDHAVELDGQRADFIRADHSRARGKPAFFDVVHGVQQGLDRPIHGTGKQIRKGQSCGNRHGRHCYHLRPEIEERLCLIPADRHEGIYRPLIAMRRDHQEDDQDQRADNDDQAGLQFQPRHAPELLFVTGGQERQARRDHGVFHQKHVQRDEDGRGKRPADYHVNGLFRGCARQVIHNEANGEDDLENRHNTRRHTETPWEGCDFHPGFSLCFGVARRLRSACQPF